MAVGLATAAHSAAVGRVRPDRKGAIAHATAGTVGLLYVLLAATGSAELALLGSFGHASMRVLQTLRAPSSVHDAVLRRRVSFSVAAAHAIDDDDTDNGRRLAAEGADGREAMWPGGAAAATTTTTTPPAPLLSFGRRVVPDWLFELTWRLRRVESDAQFGTALRELLRRLPVPPTDWAPRPWQRRLLVAAGVVVAGAPLTPLSHALEEFLMQQLPSTHPELAVPVMGAHLLVSVATLRLLLLHVLAKPPHPAKKKKKKEEEEQAKD
jgi:hypothetical protein